MSKGKKGWFPPEVIKELEKIKKEDGLGIPMKDSEAFKRLIGYSRIGKQTVKKKKIMGFDDDIF